MINFFLLVLVNKRDMCRVPQAHVENSWRLVVDSFSKSLPNVSDVVVVHLGKVHIPVICHNLSGKELHIERHKLLRHKPRRLEPTSKLRRLINNLFMA